MSYDKYIKYKNKYLQLKAKYTQVGGNLKWEIDNVFEHGEPATTQITKEESALLVLNSTSGKQKVIDYGHLINERGQKLINEEGEMNYKYVINADGRLGSRSSKKGTYEMTLTYIPDDTPRASAPPAIPPSSTPIRASGASAYAPPAIPPPSTPIHASGLYAPPLHSASGASVYAPTAIPPPSTPSTSASGASAYSYAPPAIPPPLASASGASAYAPPATPPPHASGPTLGSISASGPTLGSIYNYGVTDVSIPLSTFKTYGSHDATDATDNRPQLAYAPPPPAPLSPDKLGRLPLFMSISTVETGDRHKVLSVTYPNIGYLQPNNILKKDEATFIRVNDKQINMTFRDNVYPLKPTDDVDVWVYKYNFIV
jgi:hypothetical protein